VRLSFVVVLLLSGSTRSAVAEQQAEPGWASDMRELFENERTCSYPQGTARWACNRFAPQAMKIVYGATDFSDENGNYPLANDLATGLKNGKWPKWKSLGEATSDKAIEEAQKAANAGQPAVAVWFDTGPNPTGHVTLVIPGDLVKTGVRTKHTWKERKAPCVANWRKGSDENSFISKGMNYAFSDPKDVILYARTDVMTAAPAPRTCVEIRKRK